MELFKPSGRRSSYLYGVLSVFYIAFIASCTSIDLPDIEGKKHYFIGVVSLEIPDSDERITAVKNETLGLSFLDGMALGWTSNELVSVPLVQTDSEAGNLSATCSVVIIVRSEKEAEFIEATLKPLEGENICLIPFK